MREETVYGYGFLYPVEIKDRKVYKWQAAFIEKNYFEESDFQDLWQQLIPNMLCILTYGGEKPCEHYYQENHEHLLRELPACYAGIPRFYMETLGV